MPMTFKRIPNSAGPSSDTSAIEFSRSKIATALDSVLRDLSGAPWALLDFPAHANVGDSAIWQGTLSLLEPRLGHGAGFVTHARQAPTGLSKKVPTGPIFLLGGGNFGNLWEGHWDHRVNILSQYTDRKIIQLPQSIHFRSAKGKALEETKRAIGEHPDFTLMVRDLPSLDFAKEHFDCRLKLCPDFAFGLNPLNAKNSPTSAISGLMRMDRERNCEAYTSRESVENVPIVDWVHAAKPTWPVRLVSKTTKAAPFLLGPMAGPLATAFHAWSLSNLKRGVEILGASEIVITDRLHGHILCTLMGKPHVVLDNSYGKNFNYMDSWPANSWAKRASDIRGALRCAEELYHSATPKIDLEKF